MSDPTGVVINFVLNSTVEYIKYNVELFGGLNDNIRKLMQDMKEMKDFVKKCTEKYDDDEYLEKLANVVQDVVYQAEDTIDKYIVYSSRHKHRGAIVKPLHIKEYWGKLRAVGKECLKVKEKMKELYQIKMPIAVKEIGNVAAGGRELKKTRLHSMAQYKMEETIIGFFDEAKYIMSCLDQDSENLEVLSIVGMVGMGKTTLARKVYQGLKKKNVKKAVAYAFVIVSQKYDKKDVLLSILSHFVKITPEISSMLVNSILDKIHEELNEKEYFIVMDDVWGKDARDDVRGKDAWDDLKEAFPNNKKRSRVLITTRDYGVARRATTSTEPFPLNCMGEEESKELFRWKVFGKTGCPSNLESQIKKYESFILDKCGGQPLALVVVAGMIYDRNTRVDRWKKVSDSVKYSEHASENTSIDLVGLSFSNLPYYMKPCFIYLGVFPEDFDIPVWNLYRLWIAEGFIQGKRNLEDVAERYLEDLVDKNIVMVTEREWNGQIKKCRVHDFLREFCKKEAMNRNFFQEVKGTSPVTTSTELLSVDDYLRIIVDSGILNYVCSKPSGKRLRSFLSFTKEEVLLPAHQVHVIPKAFKLLRVFDAMAVNFKSFPDGLFYLFLVKYIAMSCDIDTISVKLSNLTNLQTFILETKSPTLNIKADIWKMEQLRNLLVNASTTTVVPPAAAPKGLTQNDSKIQTLSTISPESCTREMFERCKDLIKLGIRGNLAKSVPSLFDNLSTLESLENLKLINDDANVPLPFVPDHNKFPSMLNKLTLCRTSISWEHMSTLGKLENLMVLKLKDNAFLGDIWSTEEGGFCSLQVLHIEKTNLLEWEATSAHFPLLTTLVLKHCKRLRGIPLDFGKIASFKRIVLHWTQPELVYSAKFIQLQKLKKNLIDVNVDPIDVDVYPPEEYSFSKGSISTTAVDLGTSVKESALLASASLVTVAGAVCVKHEISSTTPFSDGVNNRTSSSSSLDRSTCASLIIMVDVDGCFADGLEGVLAAGNTSS